MTFNTLNTFAAPHFYIRFLLHCVNDMPELIMYDKVLRLKRATVKHQILNLFYFESSYMSIVVHLSIQRLIK